MAIKLIYKDVLKAAHKAFKDNRLQCQMKSFTPDDYPYCHYIFRNRVCAVGAALPEELLREIRRNKLNDAPLEVLEQHHMVEFPTEADRKHINTLQSLHDYGLLTDQKFIRLKNNLKKGL